MCCLYESGCVCVIVYMCVLLYCHVIEWHSNHRQFYYSLDVGDSIAALNRFKEAVRAINSISSLLVKLLLQIKNNIQFYFPTYVMGNNLKPINTQINGHTW